MIMIIIMLMIMIIIRMIMVINIDNIVTVYCEIITTMIMNDGDDK